MTIPDFTNRKRVFLNIPPVLSEIIIMKRYCLTTAFCFIFGISLTAMPVTLTLDGKDFLSVSEIREMRIGSETAYTVPETALELSPQTDLLIHFDADGELPEGHYRLVKGTVLSDQDSRKIGTGSGRFYTNETSLSVQPTDDALFATGNEPGDFTIQFFINPTVIENNEILLYWSNTLTDSGNLRYQNMTCSIRNRRMIWSFERFFRNTGAKIELSGKTEIRPREWSFHRLSYNSTLNLLEYSMNGRTEKILYLTPDGNEDNIDCSPLIGERPDSAMSIGLRYTGKMDELAVLKEASEPALPKLFTESGQILFRCIDLGYSGTHLDSIRLNATVPSSCAVNGYYRISENRLDFIYWNEAKTGDPDSDTESESWTPVASGELTGQIRGRYLQIAVKLMPDPVSEQTPFLNSVSVTYTPNKPPMPPIALSVIPGNGEITLDWLPAVDIRIRGYRISYGTAPGHYTHSIEIGNPEYTYEHHQQYTVKNLQNDVLYYFSVQPYDDAPVRQYGEFSKEVCGRPGRLHK